MFWVRFFSHKDSPKTFETLDEAIRFSHNQAKHWNGVEFRIYNDEGEHMYSCSVRGKTNLRLVARHGLFGKEEVVERLG